jgi:hypothetical protein
MPKDVATSKSILDNLRNTNLSPTNYEPATQEGSRVDKEEDDDAALDMSLDEDEKRRTGDRYRDINQTLFNIPAILISSCTEYASDFHKNFDYCFVFPLHIKIGYGYELTKDSVQVLPLPPTTIHTHSADEEGSHDRYV